MPMCQLSFCRSYYELDREGRSARDYDDQGCEGSHNRSPSTRGPGHVMSVNTICVYFLDGHMTKKSLPVPILHETPCITLELGLREVADPHMPVLERWWNLVLL